MNQASQTLVKEHFGGRDEMVSVVAEIFVKSREVYRFTCRDENVISRALHHAPPDLSRDAVAALHLVDAIGAAAVLEGDTRALAVWDGMLNETARIALSRYRVSDDDRVEIVQSVRTKLLVERADKPPALSHYSGKGDLRGYLRASVVRTYLNTQRGVHRPVITDDEALYERVVATGSDPELAAMRARYHDAFRQAFAQACQKLEQRQRTLLRCVFIDDLSLDELGRVMAVSRATAHRWLVQARSELAVHVEQSLRESLALSPSEFQSVANLMRSQVELSLARLLKDDH